VTRWVCEKIAQNLGSPNHFLIKLMYNIYFKIPRYPILGVPNYWGVPKYPKSRATCLICLKNCIKQTIADWAQIRPIWSPCLAGERNTTV
jgi:hypothetical protein